jgi:type IV pilus assembly protein PilA
MLRKIREAQEEEGFTLIELLVVVLIIGILAAIAIPVFLNQREKAYRDAVASDLRNGAIVMEDYYSDNVGTYPNQGQFDGLFTPTDGVTVAVKTYTDGYCLQGTHAAPALSTEFWVYEARSPQANAAVEWSGDGATACA